MTPELPYGSATNAIGSHKLEITQHDI